jgi:predicted naringenin-chalcone synthase
MRFINDIFTATVGRDTENADLLADFQPYLDALPLEAGPREELRAFVQFCLVGQRSRHMYVPALEAVGDFASRARLYQSGAEEALTRLAAQIAPAAESAGIAFDAVLTTTSTGNLMPGLGYRIAHRLGGLVGRNSLLLDLGNVGCTGGCKALNLARSLAESFRNILIVSVELPTTLLNTTSVRPDVWLGNCTFGDGAAAMWVTSTPESGRMALALEELHYWQRADTGMDLIQWDYRDYYTFAMQDEATFGSQVRDHMCEALSAFSGTWKGDRAWAIHPAGISLLMRVSRALGIDVQGARPSVDHYRRFSNMSSASVIHILNDVAAEAPLGSPIHLLTMGAGFNVIYGRLRKEA